MKTFQKHFGRIAALVLTLTLLGLAVPAAFIHYRHSLGPLNLDAPSQGSRIVVDHHGQLLRAFTTPDGRWRLPIAAKEVDPRFIAMLIAYEDRRFYTHHGVDFLSLGRAALQWISHGHIVSGGSTLTMQVARLIEPPAEKSIAAKLAQMLRAVEIEHKTSKTLAYYNRMGMLGSERGPRGPQDPGGKEVVCDGIEHAARSTTNG